MISSTLHGKGQTTILYLYLSSEAQASRVVLATRGSTFGVVLFSVFFFLQ